MFFMKLILKFCFNFLYWLDLGLNWLMLGDPSETVSSRTGRALRSGKPVKFAVIIGIIIDNLFFKFFGQVNHSINYIEHDESFEHEIWSWIKK